MKYALVAMVVYVCVVSLFQAFNGSLTGFLVFILSVLLMFILFGWKARQIDQPPISILLKIARFFPPKYARNLKQEISDLRVEYYKALVERNFWQARFILTSYYFGISWSLLNWLGERVKGV